MCNCGREHQRYLAAMQYEIEKITWARYSTFFYNNHYTKQVDQGKVVIARS